jgi:hypothetical protein
MLPSIIDSTSDPVENFKTGIFTIFLSCVFCDKIIVCYYKSMSVVKIVFLLLFVIHNIVCLQVLEIKTLKKIVKIVVFKLVTGSAILSLLGYMAI